MENKKTGYPHIDKPWMKYYEGIYIPQEEPQTNMVEVLKERNKNNKERAAYEYYGKKVSYDEMFNNVDNASKVLSNLGVKKGDIIMCLTPNIPEEEDIWFGATQIGAICDYIDPRPDSFDVNANSRKTLEILKYEKPKYIVTIDMCYLGMLKPIENELKELGINDIILVSPTDSMNLKGKFSYSKDEINYKRLEEDLDLLEDIKGFKDRNITLLKSIKKELGKIKKMQAQSKETLSEAIKSSPLRIHNYSDLVKECKNSRFEIVNDPEAINYIGHTSGTSGARPKPIALSNKNAISSMIQCKPAGIGPKEGERSLHVLPGFAPFGRYNNDIQVYYNRGTNIHVPQFILGEFGYLLKKYKPNAIMTPPAFLTSLPDRKYLENEDLSYLNRIVYGGDSMAEKDRIRLNQWLKDHGSPGEVETGHGMSEYCGAGTYAKGEYNKPNTIGIPLPKTIYTIIDPNDEEKLVPLKFEDGMEKLQGEIAVSSDHVTNGTLHGDIIVPHYVMEMDGKEYIRTKDIGYMDKDGCFFIEERKGRSFARVDGFKVKPSEIEPPIEENELVKRARIVGYYDERNRGIMPMCHLVLEKENLTDEEQVQIVEDIVYNNIIGNPNMNSRQIPAKFKIRESMPLNKGNKIDDIALRAEELTGDEINVVVNETNVAVDSIEIFKGDKVKKVRKLV